MNTIKKMIELYKSLNINAKASIWFLFCSFMQRGISMITTPLFTRLMSTSEYGHFNVFNSWFGIFLIIVSMSLYQGVYTQGLIKFDSDREIFSSSLQGLTLTLILAWSVIYFCLQSFVNSILSLTTIQMIFMFIMIWTTAIFGFWSSEQRVILCYKKMLIITLILTVARPAVGAFLICISKDKVTARILSIVVVELFLFSWMFFYQIKKGKKFFSAKYWKYAIIFNLPLIPHYLSQIVLNSADRIMIGNMIGDSEAGIYSLAYSVASIISIFVTAFSQTISPWFYQKIKEKKSNDVSSIAYSSLVLLATISLLVILFAPEIVGIFAPESYYEAVYIIPPVIIGFFFFYCYDLFAKFAFYYEKTFFIMIASIIGAILNVVLNYIFIEKYGYIAAGYTTMICFMVYSLCHYIFMRKVCKDCCQNKIPYKGSVLLLIIIPFVCISFLLLTSYKYTIYRYGIGILLFSLGVIFRRRIIELLNKILDVRKIKQ